MCLKCDFLRILGIFLNIFNFFFVRKNALRMHSGIDFNYMNIIKSKDKGISSL